MTLPIQQDKPHATIASILDNNAGRLLVAAFAISVGITLARFGPGIPMSVDTTSHLYRILFLLRWLKGGLLPFWSPDWYAGSPAILLYPPLSYYIAVVPAMLGIDPILSYKIIDAIFYWIAPIMIYYLVKEFGFSRGESALGALFFAVIPEVIENYLFFDRYPTVISIPVFCVFVIMFRRALVNHGGHIDLLASILAMSALLLTHHLSALIAGIVAVLMVLMALGTQGTKKSIVTLTLVAVGTLGLTAFWLAPFAASLKFFSNNPFYNRNVSFPFLRFLYFGFDVTSYLLGIAQFILAAVAVQSIVGRTFAKRIVVNATAFFPVLLGGMGLFQAGEMLRYDAITVLGQIIVVGSFVVFLGQFVVRNEARKVLTHKNGVLLFVMWFIIFLWIGLGYFAVPLVWLPYLREFWTRTMDVYRIWLYLALPMSALAALGFLRSFSKLWSRRRAGALLMLVLAVIPIALGVALKINYALTAHVNNVLPYSTSNAEIPPSLIEYFRRDPSPGRILGINAPFWIYVLPNYVDKPIIDGWYPQSKLITPLVDINDYRIDDLETAPNRTARLLEWRAVIAQAKPLGVTWILIGNQTLANVLMTGTSFREQMVVPYENMELVVFKSLSITSLVESDSGDSVVIARPNPDMIVLTFSSSAKPGRVVVKEAYFPTWTADADGQDLKVGRADESGYIVLHVPAGTHQVTLYQKVNSTVWNAISTISLLTCLGSSGFLLARGRKSRR